MKHKIKILETALHIFEEMQLDYMYDLAMWHLIQNKLDYINTELSLIHQSMIEG
jgi:hypothetical protein